jgi:predicted enzyme related to lactoylglutathione lyase
MTASIEITIDAVDAEPIARFWEAALGYRRLYERDPYVVLAPPLEDRRPQLVIQRVDRLSSEKTPVHIDLRVDDPDAEVERLESLGATVEWVIDESASGFIRWTTMADPQGTLFCVCPARKERSADDGSP